MVIQLIRTISSGSHSITTVVADSFNPGSNIPPVRGGLRDYESNNRLGLRVQGPAS